MLEIINLSKNFGQTQAVNNVTLSIPTGEMVGVIGCSGAGKSTFLRLINRLIEPTDGQITFSSQSITHLTGKKLLAWRAQCAMIFQQFHLVHRLDVLTNVLLGRLSKRGTLLALIKYFPKKERAEAIKALHRLDIDSLALHRADTLSGGQQQRVAIARALVQNPKIILADEPIASLDPHNAELVMKSLRSINKDDGMTVICNLHQVQVAKDYCDRVLGMASGNIIFDGPPEELSEDVIKEIYSKAEHTDELDCALRGAQDKDKVQAVA